MRIIAVFLFFAMSLSLAFGQSSPKSEPRVTVSADEVLDLIRRPSRQRATVEKMRNDWHPGYGIMLLEIYRYAQPKLQIGIAAVLGEQLGLKTTDTRDFYQAVWAKPYKPHPQYGEFKKQLYEAIDPRFAEYFDSAYKSTIRQDEIRWGGVKRDGIPPLKNPKMISANSASYLSDGDVVFGIEINGDARAYPKRILAWHEMFKDTVGGLSINGVYCTLCGSLIIYDTKVDGKHHELGTSGFLYRSNKLMYDHGTKSMWNTLTGEPVLGPLVGKGIKLRRGSVVTSTWGEWKRRHPKTTVLSLKTGHKRDYGEGIAYQEYFGTDNLMFDVPNYLKDTTLLNKDEVVGLVDTSDANSKPLAISEQFLRKNPLWKHNYAGKKLLVLTDRSGANRVYDVGDNEFVHWNGDWEVKDKEGQAWVVSEGAIRNDSGVVLRRYPSHRAFWFGWKAAYPKTQMIHKG